MNYIDETAKGKTLEIASAGLVNTAIPTTKIAGINWKLAIAIRFYRV